MRRVAPKTATSSGRLARKGLLGLGELVGLKCHIGQNKKGQQERALPPLLKNPRRSRCTARGVGRAPNLEIQQNKHAE